jgi:hypothetical protein
MHGATQLKTKQRYQAVTQEKADGATYTPSILADFVASQIVKSANLPQHAVRVLDPAVGDGELLLSVLTKLAEKTDARIDVYGFDTDPVALARARQRIAANFPHVKLHLEIGNFLEFVLTLSGVDRTPSLFSQPIKFEKFDIIIANPPYVRTQIMGAEQAQSLAAAFSLNGRVDLYHAFLIGMAHVLRPEGTAGIIVSNRFMTTKGGATLRAELRSKFGLLHIWDLGDTKIFDAAVLPAVILANGATSGELSQPKFTSIYEVESEPTRKAETPIAALEYSGVVALDDGRRFNVQHGILDGSGESDDLWRIATVATDAWLATVARHTWQTFGAIGKIRVGVKTCADKIFIRSDWDSMKESERPELLRILTTHHTAGRFRAIPAKKPRKILYPHESVEGTRRAADLKQNPKSAAYLEANRSTLEARTYVIEGGRRWYEIWVPQDPAAWAAPKLVFRDISERPTFWLDLDGTIVNGDCYWMIVDRDASTDALWLAAAVANSTFIEAFYDHRFNNKLYAGRRRFITQYVEQFPLPDLETPLAREIVALAKKAYELAPAGQSKAIEDAIDPMVWRAFGLAFKEV